MSPATAPARTRDAARSRAAILDAAETLFAERGFASTSLVDVAARAGLSRATPSYFFGDKDALYGAVLERVFVERERATEEAMAPLRAWAQAGAQGSPAAPLRAAVEQYLAFLNGRPAFVRLMTWEGLDGGRRLQATPRASRGLHDAFTALRDGAGASFDPVDAVLLFVSLTFAPLSMRDTLMTTLGRDLADRRQRDRHVDLVVAQLLHFVDAT